MIDRYLRELAAHLRVGPLRRRRILAEVQAHLRDDGGDAAAIERFGTPAEVAARFNALRPAPAARSAAACVLAGAVFVFAAVQGLEELLPPAPWPSAADAPASLRALFVAATVAIVAAAGAAVATFVLPRIVRPAAASLSCAALFTCIALLTAHAVLRAGYVPGSPTIVAPLALAALALAPVLAGTVLLARPRALRRLGF